MIKVLFICHGNGCRVRTAQYLYFRDISDRGGNYELYKKHYHCHG